MIVSVLVTAAVLLSLLAIHTAVAEPELGATLPGAYAHAEQSRGTSAVVTGAAGDASATPAMQAVDASVAGVADGMLDCALIAISCGILLTLTSLLLRVLSAAVCRRALGGVGRLFQSTYAPPLHIYRPSLTVLSVTRV